MKVLRTLVQPFYTAWAVVLFLAGLFVVLPIIAAISIGNSPRARRAIWRVIYRWAASWLWMVGMPPRRLGPRPPFGRYVVVLNHASYLDPVLIFPAVPGYFRPLGKIEFGRVPLFGFIYKQIVLLVDRSSPHSRARSMRLMTRAVRKECNVAIFPEGTFNESDAPLKEFYDGAFRLAINAQVPILPILLADINDRWHWSAWWKLWPGRNRIIYLEPVPTAGMRAADMPALKEKVYRMMEKGLIAAKA
jgi:1-acyl-sn-glycerol-3-phosphate acyltransferase